MVRVINYTKSKSEAGKEFISLKVQNGVEAVQSQSTGRFYLTARTALVSTTFDEATANALIGSSIPGTVKRIAAEPYEYTVKDTGEVITLCHRYEYLPEEMPVKELKQTEEQFEFASSEA